MLLTYEELFVATLEDLRNKIAIGKEYELIRACGLVRHLLIDKRPLAIRIKNIYKLKTLFFEVADYNNHPISKIRMTAGWTTIIPNGDVPTKKVTLENFLSIVLLNFHYIDYTVKDIIRAASHFYGGVHSFKPENKKEGYLVDLNAYASSDEKLTFMAVRAVCVVVAKAMEPLEQAIKGRTSSGGFAPQSSAA